MKRPAHQKRDTGLISSEKVKVLKHLSKSLNSSRRRYRKRLKRCQEYFSEEAVHQSRVEARRLLATIDLMVAFVPERKISRLRDALKQHLDTFDDLRDTQVQLAYVKRMTRAFPAARTFEHWLSKREDRFTKKTRRAVRHLKTKRIANRLEAFDKELREQRHRAGDQKTFTNVVGVIAKAFSRVAQYCRRVDADDTETIHRTRIAFKRFRYMTEALAPLLPGVTEQHRQAMRGYQSMMGDIQDVEVLLRTLDKFLTRHKIKTAGAMHLRQELLRRRQWLVQVYLRAADRLRLFWPPPPNPLQN